MNKENTTWHFCYWDEQEFENKEVNKTKNKTKNNGTTSNSSGEKIATQAKRI